LAIAEQENKINEQIRAKEVRLIDHNNDNLGVVPIKRALEIANEAELDLVEVAPNADPPVCKVMDYGKFLYNQKKKERAARQQQKQTAVKEIRLRPKTDEHHMGFKVRDARRWLNDGMKVKVRIWFRGREITYPELGREILDNVAEQLSDVGTVEQNANMEGKFMTMVLAPASDKEKKKT
jgi:translation initiation factor IF-3